MRFRHGAAERAAAVIWLLAGSALATARWWLAPLLFLPLLAVVAAFRRGTDFDDTGVTVRAVLLSRLMPWEDIAALRAVGPRRSVLVRTDGATVALPAVRPRDLAELVPDPPVTSGRADIEESPERGPFDEQV